MATDLIKAYEAVLVAKQYQSDPAQRQTVAALSELARALKSAQFPQCHGRGIYATYRYQWFALQLTGQ